MLFRTKQFVYIDTTKGGFNQVSTNKMRLAGLTCDNPNLIILPADTIFNAYPSPFIDYLLDNDIIELLPLGIEWGSKKKGTKERLIVNPSYEEYKVMRQCEWVKQVN